jgi:putative flippase GtrA
MVKSENEVRDKAASPTSSSLGLSKLLSRRFIIQKLRDYLSKYQILNFMVVGGIGYAINMLTYWPLTLVFKSEVSFLGQHFYLPPFVISSLIAIISNYELNKIWTFKGWSERRLASLRYLSMALATLTIDMAFLYLLVQYLNLPPVPAAALAILIVFIIRYAIARSWVWSKKS